MCGIAGIFNLDSKKVSENILHRMDSSIKHRGPDGHGEMIDKFVGIANRRLAVIDPTKRGSQPLSAKDGKLWITFNGEIFNFRQIKEALLKKGFKFETNTDTEVILNSYRFYGKNCVEKFIGQFAFAIWDKNKEELFLARDHLGVNPLYYAFINKIFLFASEIKGILASNLVKREINREALYHYLSVFSIPQPLTMISSIKSLMPGHFMVVSKKGIKTEKYWQIQPNKIKKIASYDEAQFELRKLLQESVKSSMVADVSVGAFLSGGIDSSCVVSLMAQNTLKKIKTYSLWTKNAGSAFDERQYARLVAERYDTDHTEFTLDESMLLNEFSEYIHYLDQPSGESLETYFLSKVIGRDVKVALSGLGGDELFAGYHSLIYKTQTLSIIYRLFPSILKKLVQNLIEISPFSNDFKKTYQVAEKFLNIKNPLEKRLFLYFVYQEWEKKKIFSDNFIAKNSSWDTKELLLRNVDNMDQSADLVDKLSFLDLNSYTRDNLLQTTNIASMAHSLELRVPLLDPRLVEFSFSLPSSFKLKNGASKYIFRDSIKDLLPREVITHKKTGFGLPRIKYMKNILKPLILEALSQKSVRKRGIFSEVEIQKQVNNFYSSKSSKMLWTEHLRVWTLFIFEMWAREYLD